MPPFEISHPDTGSVDELVDLWIELADDQRQYGSHVRAEPNRSQIRESLLRYVTGDRVLAARHPSICGFVMFSIEHGEFEQDVTRGIVENLYVEPGSRSEGIGSALLSAAETELDDRDADVISLGVMAENEAARRFYHRHGYDVYRVEMEK
ncbi:MAG: GNAT family N-acetyltransferase [Halovenus sp.]|uniref:GNAT family N-acetyltransferase n=1 Tax=Halovenus amylolytica TaxID=2500550 RepID=UPI000FE4250A